MKAITCEMCGSTDVLKQDGVFVCQVCGTKYSVEEAKKMMVEGTVEVVGTVKVDNSANVENLLKLAENAQTASNQKEAESYANRALEISPDNYKAWLIKGNAAGWQSTIKDNRFSESVECFGKAVDNVPEAEKEAVKKKVAEDMASLAYAMMSLCCNHFADFPGKDTANTVTQNALSSKILALQLLRKCGVAPDSYEEQVATKMNTSVVSAWQNKILPAYRGDDGKPNKYEWERFKDQAFACVSVLQCAIDFCDKDGTSDIQRYKNMILLKQELVDSCSWKVDFSGGVKSYHPEWSLTAEAKQSNINDIMKYHEKIKELDPSYVIPERPTPKKNGGCYVATAVYGSYDCPQVWALRRFRDYTLAQSVFGRAFIHTYYAISPTLVKWFGETAWFKGFWRGRLDSLVAKLREEGVEDTVYEDRSW